MTVTTVDETALAALPAQGEQRSGNMLVQLISAGVGSSGVYSPEVLESAATSGAFGAGTLMFADHPGEAETWDRPERSIRDVAGVLVENARYDTDAQALVAEVRTYSPWTDVLAEMAKDIGVSIRATATVEEAADGGPPVVTAINEGISVDFVTKAGRGGAIREVYESARGRHDLIVRETGALTEASANTREQELRALVRAAHAAGSGQYAYVIDYDEADRTVLFEIEGAGSATGIYRQSFTITDDVATALAGDPVQVRRVVSYVPVSEASNPSVPVTPAGQPISTHESEEDNMPTIEEARLRELEEADRRVPMLESERDTAVSERDTARQEVTEAHREADEAVAARIIAEADHDFNALEVRGLLAGIPLTEAGRLDADAFTTAVTEAAATAQEATGAGQVQGLGGSTQPTGQDGDLSESDMDTELAAISGRTVKEA